MADHVLEALESGKEEAVPLVRALSREICGRADRLEAGCLDNLRRGTYSVENGMIFLSLAGMMRQACGRLENIALLSAALGRYEWAGNPASTMRQTPTA